MADLQEHQKHISDGTEGALCGAAIEGFHLLDFSHAVNCILAGSRILPCAECWSKVLELAEGDPRRFVNKARVLDVVDFLVGRAEYAENADAPLYRKVAEMIKEGRA